jgi:hypothetical protein
MPTATLRHRLAQALLGAAAAASGVAALFCGALYFTLYWPYRALFDAQGRYFDEAESVVYHDDAAVFGATAIGFVLLAVALAHRWRARRRRAGSRNV